MKRPLPLAAGEMQYTSAIMMKAWMIAVLMLVALPGVVQSQAALAQQQAASGSKADSTLRAAKVTDSRDADAEAPIAGQEGGPTFIYNTQKEQQKDKWDKAAVLSQFALAGVGLVALVLGFLILQKLKRQTEVLEQTVVLQHRPRLQVRRVALDAELKEIAFTIANAGGTKAFVREGRFMAKQIEGEPVGVSLFEEAEPIGEFYLEAGAEKVCSIAVEEETLRQVEAGRADTVRPDPLLIFAGVIRYRDNLGIERSVGVHRALNPDRVSFKAVTESDAEYSD